MASFPRTGLASVADLDALPDDVRGEIVAGTLEISPHPSSPHRRVASRLGAIVGRSFDLDGTPGGWWIEKNSALDLGIDHYIPDVAGWRRDRHPVYPEGVWIDVPPDWVCEILSPSTARLDRAIKMPNYQRFGVAHLWLIDVENATVEVYRRVEAGWLLVTTATTAEGVTPPVRLEPFDAVPIDLDLLFSRTPPVASSGA